MDLKFVDQTQATLYNVIAMEYTETGTLKVFVPRELNKAKTQGWAGSAFVAEKEFTEKVVITPV